MTAVTLAEPRATETTHLAHLVGAAVAAVVCGGLAFAARTGRFELLIAIAAVQAVLIVCWVFGTNLPGRRGSLIIGALAGGAADAVLWAWPDNQLGPLAAVLGLALPAMFIHQLTRGVVRARVVESLADIAFLVIAVVALSALLPLEQESGGMAMTGAVVAAAGAALVAGYIVDAAAPVFRLDPAVPRGLLGLLIAIVAGAVAAAVRLHHATNFSESAAAGLGAVVGAVAGLLAIGAAFINHGAAREGVAVARVGYAAIVPVALSAPIGYVLCLALRS